MPATITVQALFDRYAREVSPEKGGARWEQIRPRAIAPAFPTAAVAVDGATLAERRDKRLLKVSASSVNRELNLISAVFTRAIKEWRLPLAVNPAHTILWPRKPRHKTRRSFDAERAAILTQLGWDGSSEPGDLRAWVAFTFVLALETMMRLGKIRALTWQHVHTDQKLCHLPKTKNGDSRNVPLSSRAAALSNMVTVGADGNRVVPVDGGTLGVYFRRAVRLRASPICASTTRGVKRLHVPARS
jgi:integrase